MLTGYWKTGGFSGGVVLEIDPDLGRHAIASLLDDGLSWQRTLHFAAHGKWHFLFEYARGLPSFRGYPGVRLHAGGPILVPPSRTPSGIELAYADPDAALLSADWLRDLS